MAIPCLHISLGVFHKLFQLYELQGCHNLDLLLAKEKAEQGSSHDSGSFGQFVAAVRHAQQLVLKAAECQQEASELDEFVTWITMTTPEEADNLWALTFCDEAKAMRQKAATLVRIWLFLQHTVHRVEQTRYGRRFPNKLTLVQQFLLTTLHVLFSWQ